MATGSNQGRGDRLPNGIGLRSDGATIYACDYVHGTGPRQRGAARSRAAGGDRGRPGR